MNLRVSNQKNAALTLVEVLVVICVVAVLAFVFLPALTKGGPKGSYSYNCIMNLRQIGLAYRLWAIDHSDKYPMQVSVTNGGTMELNADGSKAWLNYLVISNKLSTPKILVCPSDTNRVAARNFRKSFSATNVSYFVGLDADIAHPRMFLSGDDNFAIGGVPVKSGLLAVSTNAPITWTSTRHANSGNIGFVDGAAGPVTSSTLQRRLAETGVATNRLAIP